MKPHTNSTLDEIYRSFSQYYIGKYGENKFNKISERVLLSKTLAELIGTSILIAGTPSVKAFLLAIENIPYFMFAGTDTTILACMIAIKQWDEKVNQVYCFAGQPVLDDTVQSVFKILGKTRVAIDM